jgi:LmbE family N-acetylglucosaminyl deacetylase
MDLAGRENLGLPDTRVAVTPEAIDQVTAAIRRWRPRIVLGPCSEDLHPDHLATSELVDRAYYRATMAGVTAGDLAPHRPDALIQYYGHLEPTPTFVVDVSDVWDRRMDLVRCYASQLGLDGREGPTTNIASPDFLRRMESRFAYWGGRIGAKYAEPFRARRVVPIDDPVEVFRKRGWAVL